MSQSDIDAFLSLVRGKQPRELGQAILAVNRLSMVDMLRAFQGMATDDRARFNAAAFDGVPGMLCTSSPLLPPALRLALSDCVNVKPLPETKQVGIDRIEFAFRVVTEKKVPDPIPGDLYETGQMRDAYNFLGTPAPTTNVWATVIGSVCEDAQLRKKDDSDIVMRTDTTYGQAGWDVGIMYGTGQFNSLPKVMARRCRGKMIKKLSINAHGDAGLFAANGVNQKRQPLGDTMKSTDLPGLKTKFGVVFDFLNNVMSSDGMVLLQGCLAGRGGGGTDLLQQLSLELRPRKVVGFSSVGFQSVEKQRRDGEVCREPGARDSEYPENAGSEVEEFERYFKDGKWENLSKLPWQSETSPHAKVAWNGVIIKGEGL